MSSEGRLDIRIRMADGQVRAVGIQSSRPVLAAAVFHGRRIEECQDMLPLLYSVCGNAQACAGARACERALGLPVRPAVERSRELLLRMETVREHLWRVLLDWPAFAGVAGAPGPMSEAAGLQREYRQALCADADPFRVGAPDSASGGGELDGLLDRLQGLLRREVFAMPAAQWLELSGEEALAAWAAGRRTVAAGLIDDLITGGQQGAGACHVAALPKLDPLQLDRAMRDNAYLHQPHCFGNCRETGCLARAGGALLNRLKRDYGNGLLVRVVARLSELAELAGRLLPDAVEPLDDPSAGRVGEGIGIGQAAAARGQLVHRVELDGERIAGYRILAPTEWNFHPRGVVARAIGALQGGPAQVEAQARLLINAVDPCVGYRLHIDQDLCNA